jgi:cytochrome c
MAERIAYLLIPAYCSPPTTNRTGEVRLDEMGPCLGKAGLVLMAVLASSSAALAAGDPSAGQTVFASHCAVCHSTQAGVNKIAPSLAGIVGSKSGTVCRVRFLTGDEGCKHHLGRQQCRCH